MSPKTTIETNLTKPMTQEAANAALAVIQENYLDNHVMRENRIVLGENKAQFSVADTLLAPFCAANAENVKSMGGYLATSREVFKQMPMSGSLTNALNSVVKPIKDELPSIAQLKKHADSTLSSTKYIWAAEVDTVFKGVMEEAIAAASEVMGVYETTRLIDVEQARITRNS